MMKLACASISFKGEFAAGSMNLFSFIDECRRLDVDSVDLNAPHFASADEAYLREVKMRCVRNGLPIGCLNISNNFGMADAVLGQQVEMTKRWIDNAQYLGAPQVRVFAGSTPPGDSDMAARARATRALKVVADYGYTRGVLVALQNHNHGALTKDGDEVLRLLERAGPHLGHVWDTGQYVGSPGASGADRSQGAQERLYRSLEQTVHLATHVRTKIYRITGGVEEWLDYPRIFGMLRTAGYNVSCAIVYEGPGGERTAVASAVHFLRQFVP
jgi:sugar phosphate isomerase/epimerase